MGDGYRESLGSAAPIPSSICHFRDWAGSQPLYFCGGDMPHRLTLWLLFALLFAQNESDEAPLLRVDQGLSFRADTMLLLNLRFRMQNRFGYLSQLDDTARGGYDIRVRRLRLRLDGFIGSPRLTYYIQLSFAAGDHDFVRDFPLNIVRDAMAYYFFSPRLYVGLGQAKLPGNRQRVVSSGNLQMPDRSYANQFFTLDRDAGFFIYGMLREKAPMLLLKGAITGGEGRLALPANFGLAYTLRAECLPFGRFRNNGDYSEGDLEYEAVPRLAIGATVSHNRYATRIGGQLGRLLRYPVHTTTWIADAILKYRGFAFQIETFWRRVDPLFPDEAEYLSIYTGFAGNLQLSKVFLRRHEISLRYTWIDPPSEKQAHQARWESWGTCYSYYLRGHRVKAQLYGGIDNRTATRSQDALRQRWVITFQVEVGI